MRWRSAASRTALVGLLLLSSGCGGDSATYGEDSVGTAEAVPASVAAAATDEEHASEWDVSLMPDPCRTLTPDEVSATVGRTASTGVRLDSWPPLCQYLLGPEALLLYVADNSQPSGAVEFDQLRNSGMPTEAVAGLGDDAYWLPSSTALHVMAGTTHVKVTFAGPGVPPVDEARVAAVALATLVVGRVQ